MPDRPESVARRRALQQRLRARHEVQLFARRLGILLSVLVAIVVASTVGYSLIEGTSVGYALTWALDTITTVGAIPEPQDTGARVLKAGLELFGIGTLFYGLVTVAEFFVSGQLSGMLEERRVQTSILYPAINEFSAYAGSAELPRSELVARSELTLPLFPQLREGDQERVVTAVADGLRRLERAPSTVGT